MTGLSRRSLLSAVTVAGSAPPAEGATPAPPPHADAVLIALCAEFNTLTRIIDSAYSNASCDVPDEETDRLTAPYMEQQEALLDRICPMQATTADGFMARAKALVLWDRPKLGDDPGGCWNDRMLAALLRDMTAGGMAA